MNKKHNFLKKPINYLLFFILLLFLFLQYQNPLLLWDENAYLGNARAHISNSYFTEDFRFPLLEYFISGFWLILGESIFAARLFMILCSLLTIYVFYLIAEYYFPKKGFYCTILFSLNPIFLKWGVYVYPNMLGLLLITTAYYFLLKESKKHYILCGFLGSLAFLSWWPFALFLTSIFLVLLYKKEYNELKYVIIGSLIGITPWLIYNTIIYHNPFWDLCAYWNQVAEYTLRESLIKHIIHLWNNFGCLMLFLPIGVYNIIKTKKKNCNLLILYTLLCIIYFSFFVNLKLERYYISILPFVYIIIITGILFFVDKINNNNKLKNLFFVIIFLYALILFLNGLDTINKRNFCYENEPTINAINYLEENTKEGELINSNIWPWFGYYNNLNACYIWTEDIDLLMKVQKPKYVIYHNKRGVEYNLSVLIDAEKQNKLIFEKEYTGSCGVCIYIWRYNYSN